MRRSIMHYFLLAAFLPGCVTVEMPEIKQPAIIAVRNQSPDDLNQVQLAGVSGQQMATGRFGSVSPVPRGITQSVVRARKAPPLPPLMRILWTDQQGRRYQQTISIEELLSRATGSDNEVIVFVITHDHRVMVSLEYN